MEPKFDQDRPVIDQAPFHRRNLFVCRDPFGPGTKSFHPFHEHASVPTAIEDGNVPVLRHSSPKPPEIMVTTLDVVGSGNRDDLIAPGVETCHQSSDAAPLACRVPTFTDDDHGNSVLVNAVFEVAELLLEAPKQKFVSWTRERLSQIDFR